MPKLERRVVIEIIKKAFFVWTGLCLVAIGIVFSLIPFVPGFIPLILGVALIARGSKSFRKYHHIKKFLKFIKDKLRKEKSPLSRLASFF